MNKSYLFILDIRIESISNCVHLWTVHDDFIFLRDIAVLETVLIRKFIRLIKKNFQETLVIEVSQPRTNLC